RKITAISFRIIFPGASRCRCQPGPLPCREEQRRIEHRDRFPARYFPDNLLALLFSRREAVEFRKVSCNLVPFVLRDRTDPEARRIGHAPAALRKIGEESRVECLFAENERVP